MSVESNSDRKKAMEYLLAQVELDGTISWGYDIGCAQVSFGELWEVTMKAHLGSLDAAKTLHEAVVPGWNVTYLGQKEDGWTVVLARVGPLTGFYGKHPNNPARSWLIAILKVLIERISYER